jgi:hypothetical protein
VSPATLKNAIVSFATALCFIYASDSAAARPEKVVGIYELEFAVNTVGELILQAHIEDPSGNPATDGVVVFQYCSYKGLPPKDITQPDEAPSSACANGTGRWRNLIARIPVTANGDAFLNFGTVTVVNVIGFRYTYSRGTQIADWVTDPKDWFRL